MHLQCMYLLTKGKAGQSIRLTLFKLVLEALQVWCVEHCRCS